MAEAAMKQEAQRLVQVPPSRFKQAQYERNEWVVDAPEGCTVEDIQKNEFWAFISTSLRPFDRIEVRADNGSWMAELVVINCDRGWAQVSMLNKYQLASLEDTIDSALGFEVEWKGPHNKWSVIRKSDSNYLHKGAASKREAEDWLRGHLQAQGTG